MLALLQASGFTLSGERLPDGRAKRRILRAVDQARACIPLRAPLQFFGLSPSRFHAWRQRQTACALNDQSSCPRTAPHQLTAAEVRAIEGCLRHSLLIKRPFFAPWGRKIVGSAARGEFRRPDVD